jgi:nucleoside-diphosphate-sugar epimerase
VWIVTGASGFVGGHLLAALALSAEARGLSRSALPSWNFDSLRRALEGAQGVVHAASVVHKPSTSPDEYTRFNVDGTRLLLAAARDVGVRRFVFISSIKVHGETPRGVIDHDTQRAPEAHYARTKAAAEDLVLEAGDLRPIVLRLCPVYGRGDKGNVRTMIRAISRRSFLIPGDGSTRKSIVHVSTVANVVRAVTERGEASGTFVVADRNAPSIRELADAIAMALGRRPPISVPEPILQGAALLVERLAGLVRVKTPISGDLIVKAMTSSVCDPVRVERELGVRCTVDLHSALRDEIAWLRELHVI